jgi:subtilisin family serine protease
LLSLGLSSSPVSAVEKSASRSVATIPGRFIAVYKRSVDKPGTRTAALERAHGFKAKHRFAKTLSGFSAELSPGQVKRLEQDPAVEVVVPDRPVHATTATATLRSGDSIPPGIRRIGAASTSAVSGPGATVAVLDSGIDLSHPDLSAFDGKNCIGTGPATDDNGHGTHVAGTIGAENDGSGVTGVAPGTRLMSVKVLGADGSGSWSSMICGIEWVTSTLADSDPSNDVRVANMSLGGLGDPVRACSVTTDPLHRAICKATDAGVSFIVAAGNDAWDFDHPTVPDVPAAYPEVLTVTAMTDTDGKLGALGTSPGCSPGDRDDRYASFSNFAATPAGEAHTVAAPGTCIRSTVPGARYATWSGTSMAAPHIAGAVALCVSENSIPGACSGLSPSEVIARVRRDAQERASNVPTYGFVGDTDRPLSGVHFGRLLWAGDSISPTVARFTPLSSSEGVALDVRPTVTFSEGMNASSTQQAFSLRRGEDGSPVGGTFTWSGQTMTFRPSSPLQEGTGYVVSVSSTARDAAFNPLAPASWTFTTQRTGTSVPTSVAVQSGSVNGGGAASLGQDDGSFLKVSSTSSGTRTSAWYGSVSGVPNEALSLKISFRGSTSVSCAHNLAIWKWSTGSWTSLDSRTLGTGEIGIDKVVGGSLSEFVDNVDGPGEVRVRSRCTNSSSSFVTRSDLLKVTYTYR